MFKITPIQTKNEQKEIAEVCLAAYKEDCFAYSMRDCDTGEIMGFSQFEIRDGYGYIADLKPRANYSDDEAMFILGRATMNFIDLCGVHICKADKDGADAKLLHAIGFRETNGELTVDMTGMFDGKCNGE